MMAWDGRPLESRGGFTVVEVALSIVLIALLLSPLYGLLGTQRRSVEELTARAEGNRVVRIVDTVLREEARRTAGAVGAAALLGPRRLGIRGYRGTGIPCRLPGGGATADPRDVHLSFRGTRMPEPAKDSVEALLPGGGWWVTSLGASTRVPECDQGDRRGLRITLSAVPPDAVLLVRIFETGVYHLTGGALRYQRGAGGRQPLTPLQLEDGSLSGALGRGGGLGIRGLLLPEMPGRPGRAFQSFLAPLP